MRKILYFFLVCFSILYATVIDENKLDLYYANGIMMQDSEAESDEIWRMRVQALLKKHPNYYKRIGKVDVAYNISHGMVADMWEAFLQKVDLEPDFAIGWLGFKEFIGRMTPLEAGKYFIEALEFANAYVGRDTLNEQVEKYKKSIKNGHKVLLVAHSQGNLFTNEVYKIKKQIAIIYR